MRSLRKFRQAVPDSPRASCDGIRSLRISTYRAAYRRHRSRSDANRDRSQECDASTQPYVQIPQLVFIDDTWRTSQWTRGRLRFWKCNYVANGLRADHQHHEAVDAERNAAVRWAAESQCIEQESKPHIGFLTEIQNFEHGFLHFAAVHADRSAAEFVAVQHDIVRTRACRFGICKQ